MVMYLTVESYFMPCAPTVQTGSQSACEWIRLVQWKDCALQEHAYNSNRQGCLTSSWTSS